MDALGGAGVSTKEGEHKNFSLLHQRSFYDLYDVMQAKPGKDGKTYWRNLGVAFEKNGRISSIKLECLPLPNTEGEVFLQVFEQKPKSLMALKKLN